MKSMGEHAKFIIGFISLAAATQSLASSPPYPGFDRHPDIMTDEVELFAAGPDHPAVKVRSGDIALRLGDYLQIALGTYPVPKDFKVDLKSPEGTNWNLYRMVYSKLHIPTLSRNFTLLKLLGISLHEAVSSDLGHPEKGQSDIPEDLRITNRFFQTQMRGNFKKLQMDDANHEHLAGFNKNYYKLDFLNHEDDVRKIVHYYPGTPFVSHAGIISVERENGVPRIYVYDAVAGKDSGKDQEDPNFDAGIRKITPEKYWNNGDAVYGVVVRPEVGGAQDNAGAAEAAWKIFKQSQENNPVRDYFDNSFDWRQSTSFTCSDFVWWAYVSGAHQNIVSDLNMSLVPAWAVRRKTGYEMQLNLLIVPQSFLLSTKTRRIVDFESGPFTPQLKSLAESNTPLPLPAKDTRDDETNHVIYSTDYN